MRIIAMLGTAAFVLVGAVVGARMLLLARRTRKLPELYVGGALFLYAGIGQPLVVASRPLGEAFGFETRVCAIALALVAIVAAMVGLYLFTWTVYRRDSKAARLGVWLAGCAAILSGVTVVRAIPETAGVVTDDMRLGIGSLSLVFLVGMAWAAWESLRYYAMLRKRLALGLTEPIVVNRFLLWGSGCGATTLSSLSMIVCAAAGMDVAAHPVPLLVTAVGGIIIASCWYLTFLPPEGYRRWVGGNVAAQGA